MHIISKPTRREQQDQRRADLYRAGLDPARYKGVAGSVEQAHDTQRLLEREGETFDKLWAVTGPEADKADAELAARAGAKSD
jgi:hypothetical protein